MNTPCRCAFKRPGKVPEDNTPWEKGTFFGLFQEGGAKDRLITYLYVLPDGNDVPFMKIHDVRLVRLNPIE